jgi:hypothetical protein
MQYCVLSILYCTALSRLCTLAYIMILSHKVICRHIPPSFGFKIVLKSDILQVKYCFVLVREEIPICKNSISDFIYLYISV